MNAFATTDPLPVAEPNPAKHVRYTLGMVLGVDDFNQEFAYLSGRDQWLARDLIGYGTAWGLRVSTQADATGPRIQVDPGVALSPRGQLIRVCKAQCASLAAWLSDAAHQQTIGEHIASPAGDLRLYVTLCYRDCATDPVPIPGEPCRCDSETTAASRTADDFCLELRFDPPRQHEEDAIRSFVSWLRAIPIADPSELGTPLAEFETVVRDLATLLPAPVASPPVSPDWDLEFGSPPSALLIPHDGVCDYLRAAFRIWTTELRPKWRPAPPCHCGCGCGDAGADHADDDTQPQWDDCVLLAAVDVSILQDAVTLKWVLGPGEVTINEDRRPYLLHLRMLKEWLLCGRRDVFAIGSPPASPPTAPGEALLDGDVTGPASANRIAMLQGQALSLAAAPATNDVLQFDGGAWRNAPLPQAPPVPAPVLAGDTVGPVAATVVQRIQKTAVAPDGPADGQVLTFVATENRWKPQSPAAAPGPFVEHPSGRPKYFLVAAGTVRSDGVTRDPVYNKLKLASFQFTPTLLQFAVTFRDDRPSGDFNYVAKALPVLNELFRRAPYIVTFSDFKADPSNGAQTVVIVFGLVPARGEFPQQMAAELMIEVSRYDA